MSRSLASRISLQRGPSKPALPAASMVPAAPGLGERPTGARVVRRHLFRRGTAPVTVAKRSAWWQPLFVEVRLFGPPRLSRGH